MQGNPETVTTAALINPAQFAHAGMPGADILDLDVQDLKAGNVQPAFSGEAEQSRQHQPEQE